ncbi:MAG: hypothetical protein R3F61_25315 [Myxococcota bacterium]
MRFTPLLLILLAACDPAPEDTDVVDTDVPTDTDTDTPDVTFDDVHAVFNDRCGPCHVTAGSGGMNIGAADIDAAYADSQLAATGGTVGDFALTRIENGSMPQGAGCTGDPAADAGNVACLSLDELELVQAWVAAGQPR